MKQEDIKLKLNGEIVLPIGMRGTSYEMVIKLFESGVLTGNPDEYKRRGESYIYIWPIRENWKANGLNPRIQWGGNYWNPVESSKRFARIHVERDYFERVCGFPIGEYKGWLNPSNETNKKIQSEMKKRKLTDSDIEKLIEETKRRKGYILEFHPDLAVDYHLSPDDWFGENHSISFQIDCRHGIGIDYISKISPIGEYDLELIEKYMKEANSK